MQEFRSLPDVEKGVLTLQLFVVVALKQAFFSTVLSQLLDERCIETVEVILKLPKMEIPYLRRYFRKFPILPSKVRVLKVLSYDKAAGQSS